MSYEKNPFKKALTTHNEKEVTAEIETTISEISPIYKDPIKRETIYEKVKIHKPIVINVPYKGSNYSNQNNFTTYDNTTYTPDQNIIDNNDYNNLIYGQTATTTTETNNTYNYDYNTDNNTYTQTTNTTENYNYETQGNTNYTNYTDYTTNYDYNNLTYGENTTITTNPAETYNYNDIIYNQDNTVYTENNTYDAYNTYNTNNTYNTYNAEQVYTDPTKNLNTNNNTYSLPYIAAVSDNNEIIYSPEANKFDTNKIGFSNINTLIDQNTIIKNEKPKEKE